MAPGTLTRPARLALGALLLLLGAGFAAPGSDALPGSVASGAGGVSATAPSAAILRATAASHGLAALLATPAGGAPAPGGAPAQNGCIMLDDFAASVPGQFPGGWRPRDEAGRPVYTVREEGGRRFLRAESEGVGVQAGLAREWDLTAHPVLAWSWRPLRFPRGADERQARRNDSALAVYLLVPYLRVRGPRALKYVWSERVPVGTPLESNGGLTQGRVLRSGLPHPGEWVEERVDVLADYRRRFGTTAPPTPAGIAVLTDADDTRSRAAGDYANFRACR